MKNTHIYIFNNHIIIRSFVFLILGSFSISAQNEDDLGTEVVNVVKPYSPTISDAFKVKEKPISIDTITTRKKEVTYSIFSVPVASTFTPSKGKASVLEKAKPMKTYDNYASLGFGNYTTILGEFFSNFQLSRTDNAGIFFKHNSSQGGIDGVRLDDSFYDTSLIGNYTSRQRDATFEINAGIEHQVFNWYGLPDEFNPVNPDFITNFDAQQIYYGGFIGGSIMLDDSLFKGFSTEFRYLGDAYASSEINVIVAPQFSVPVSDFNLNIDTDINYLSGSFDRSYYLDESYKYGFLNVDFSPTLEYMNEELELSFGVSANVVLNTEKNESQFTIYPRLKASYKLMDELLIGYAGVEGDIQQNSYYRFKNENPYVSPTLHIEPTQNVFMAFAGIKGKFTNSIAYNLMSSYGKSEEKPLFTLNSLKDSDPAKSYQFGNSFQVVYDELKTLSFMGELKVEVSEVITMGIYAKYHTYSTDIEEEAWNLPSIEASVFSNFNITEKFYAGASLFYVGERKDQILDYGPTQDPFPEQVTLDAYLDANVHFGYKASDQLSFFVKGSNLIGGNYLKWYNYPVQSIQGLMGATYKFDW